MVCQSVGLLRRADLCLSFAFFGVRAVGVNSRTCLPRQYTGQMRRLIVNADDYGLTPGVNLAIQELNAAGCLTSATLMAGAQHARGISPAQGLAIGCHVVLLDGSPVAPLADVASLLKPGTETFYPTLSEFLWALFSGKIQMLHVRNETAAQLNRLLNLGIQLTHVDTHKHTHMFPTVLQAVLAAAADAGVRAVRNPFEPAWAVSATPIAGFVRKLEVTTLRALYAQSFLSTVGGNGFATTDGAIGVAATGSLDPATLRSLLASVPEGTWELVCHPGHVDEALGSMNTRLRESRETEAVALAQLPTLLGNDTGLVHFGDITA